MVYFKQIDLTLLVSKKRTPIRSHSVSGVAAAAHASSFVVKIEPVDDTDYENDNEESTTEDGGGGCCGGDDDNEHVVNAAQEAEATAVARKKGNTPARRLVLQVD